MNKVLRLQRHGNIEISFAENQVGGPWVSLAGDCFFRHLHRDFSVGPLRIEDCPFTMSYPRSKIDELMDAVENLLPPTTGLLIIHVGANNVASTRFPARQAASILLGRCIELMRSRPQIGEISICLLSPRTLDDHGVYSSNYINYYNEKAAAFNDEITRRLLEMPQFSYIDFKLEQKNLWFLLRETGFGVNDGGRQTLAQTLQAIIIWKRLVGEGIRRGEPSTSRVPDRLLNIPFESRPLFAPFGRAPSESPAHMLRNPPLSCAPEPWLNPPTQRSFCSDPLLRAPSNYSDSRLQGQFQNYLQDFAWNDNRQPFPDQPSGHLCPANFWRAPLLDSPMNLPAHFQPPPPPPPVKPYQPTRSAASRPPAPCRKRVGKRVLKSIRKARAKKSKLNYERIAENFV